MTQQKKVTTLTLLGLGHQKKTYMHYDPLSLQVTDLCSPNLHRRHVWRGYTNCQIHSYLDLRFWGHSGQDIKTRFWLGWQTVTVTHRHL